MTNNDKTNASSVYNDIDEGYGNRKDDISQEAIDYRNTKMASRELYNLKQIKIRVYPLGNRKYVLPRKAM